MIEYLTHNRIRLALHSLRAGRQDNGRALLLLHGLAERAPRSVPDELADWPGPVFALDFTGHGESTIPHGGGYTGELLLADADTALQRLGEATVVGRGLGGYVALMLAGARPKQVRGAILRDGPGFAGGGAGSTSPFIPIADLSQPAPPDPFALAELATDVRPRDYACTYARQAAQLSGLSRPLSICARERPAWLQAVLDEDGVEVCALRDALALYAGV